ncbi:MAG TPA: COX15/CtaA family protein [Mycobacteriales bacterium]|nr:COX15/CtaA family protein [Mycobacteriales bacterium]
MGGRRPQRRVAVVPLGVVRRLAVSALVLQMALVVSGGAVRVTGSGLGCPSWPTCTSSSLSTTSELGLHGAIEFGNRLLAVVMEAVGVLLVLAVRRHAPRLTRLALVQALVVPLQAVIGGLLVLSDLNPYVLILHFLTSFPLVYCAAWLLWSLSPATASPAILSPATQAEASVPPPMRTLSVLLVVSAAAVLVLGTLVTGTGPHAGDPDVERLPFNPLTVTRLHTDAVYVLVGLVLAALALTWGTSLRRWALLLAALVLGQGALGYWQYFHGVPPFAVAVHVAGATAVFTTAVWLQLSSRRTTPA